MMDTIIEPGEPEEVFALVGKLKETGNGVFKRGEFGLVIALYDMEAKYLLHTWIASTVDSDMCKDFAVSLHLNLTVCAIKVGSF